MLSQVSIFAENKKGRLQNITSLLQKENINIWGSITNDSAEYGIIRMVGFLIQSTRRKCWRKLVISAV